jgi:sugar (pentulose or hexulose) kinase
MVRELADMVHAAGMGRVCRVIASGNAVRQNPLACRVIRSLFGAECLVAEAREEAALGAAYATAVGLGLLPAEAIHPPLAQPA